MEQSIQCGKHLLDLSIPRTMGILNVTPDSFSDGGMYNDVPHAVRRAWEMVEEGASIVDIGGESTRPGAAEVSLQQELERVIPVIRALVESDFPVPISIDTSKPTVMQQAVQAGAGFINDVRALREPGAMEIAKTLDVPVCLMHMQGQPRQMQKNPQYQDVFGEVMEFLKQRIGACLKAGFVQRQLLIDPGFGFGKSLQHNLILLGSLNNLEALNIPVLVGISRKSMLGSILEAHEQKRVYGGIAAACMAVDRGARIVRTHDVRATVEALKIVSAVRAEINQ